MKSLIIGLPISAFITAFFVWLYTLMGFHAFAGVMIVGSILYIALMIYRDWEPSQEEWADGETTGYGRDQ